MAIDSKTPAQGAAPCSTANDAWQSRRAGPQRERCESRSPGMGAPSLTSTSGPASPEDPWASRCVGPTTDRDERDLGAHSARAGVVTELSQVLHERSLQTMRSESPTPTECMVKGDINGITAEEAIMSKMPWTSVDQMPPAPDRRVASMWEIPQNLDLSQDAPNCHCGKEATLWISKTEHNPDRLFWKCSQNKQKNAASFNG